MKFEKAAKLSFAICIILVISMISNSCGDSSDSENANNLPPDANACSSAIVTDGFGLSWKGLNHRMTWYKIDPLVESCQSDKKELSIGFIGGDFSTGDVMKDTPFVDYSFQNVKSDKLGFYSGSLEFTLKAPENALEKVQKLSIKDMKLTGFDAYIVLINGIEYDTRIDQDSDYPDNYNHKHGYTSRGIGARVDAPEINGDELTFKAWMRFDHGPLDRPDMNEAMKYAKTKAVLQYVVVGVEGGNIATVENGYSLSFPEPEALVDQEIKHADKSKRQKEVVLKPELANYFGAITSFDFQLDPDGTADPEIGEIGYYIREYSLKLSLSDYNMEKSSVIADIDGYASNATAFVAFHALNYKFIGKAAVIQFENGTKTEKSMRKEFTTGEVKFSLDEIK